MKKQQHWEQVYHHKQFNAVSWYAAHLDQSLNTIRTLVQPKTSAIIDIGCGESTLIDDLLDAGYYRLSALDIASNAIAFMRQRLGAKAQKVHWYEGDITHIQLPAQAFDLWHDRAVFHFLTDTPNRLAYRAQLKKALRPGGYAVIATFAPDGPQQCSGLDVVRYDPQQLHQALGPEFEPLGSSQHQHQTPLNKKQSFLYCWFQRLND